MEVNYRYYDLNFFEQAIFNGIQYRLSTEVLQMIQMVEKEIQIPSENSNEHTSMKKYDDRYSSSNSSEIYNGERRRNISSKQSKHNERFSNNKKNYLKNSPIEEQELSKQFKATKFESKEGIEKKISEIRALINKISTKNYDTQKDEIIRLVKELLEMNNNKRDNATMLSNVLFEIAGTNKFFSEIYAELYKEFVKEFGMFDELLNGYLLSFKNTIDSIHYVDPDINYDGYCQYNKINDQRKSMTVFLMYLLKNGVLQKEEIIDLLSFFLFKTMSYIDEKDRTKDVEEITENVFLIVSNGFSIFEESEKWQNEIYPKIIEVSKMKQKEHISLASRVVFKYMDIIDKICCPKNKR
jgi:hypothetical protein